MKNCETLYQHFRSLGIEVEMNEPMKDHTSFKIGGPASLFVMPADLNELAYVWKKVLESGEKHLVVGKGTNLLVDDNGFDGIVICLDGGCDDMEYMGNMLLCQAGVSVTHVCRFAAGKSLTGMEFAYGIPGSVGGAIAMNAGAYGGEIKDILESVSYFDEKGEYITAGVDELDLSYRHSIFSDRDCLIVQAVFYLEEGDKEQIAVTMDEIMHKRKDKQPLEYPSAGSTFKRPKDNYASALIDQCGLRGERIGGAMVSEKHAGFIINADNATAKDVKELVAKIQATVKEKTGYELECEIKLV